MAKIRNKADKILSRVRDLTYDNRTKISAYLGKQKNLVIWIVVPLLLFLIPLTIRLFFISGYYFIHANLALSTVILSLLHYHYRQKHNLIIFKFGIILSIFFLLLTLLESFKYYPKIVFANLLYESMMADYGIQEALGITSGFASIFVFLIASRICQHTKLSNNTLQGFRTVAGMTAILSLITTLGLFGIQSSYSIKWLFQIVIVGGGLFIGLFSFVMGILYGGSKDIVLAIIGIIVVFVIGLIFGIGVIVFSGKGEILYLSQFSFASNLNLIIGLFLYTLKVSETPWNNYIEEFLGDGEYRA